MEGERERERKKKRAANEREREGKDDTVVEAHANTLLAKLAHCCLPDSHHANFRKNQ